MIYLPLLAVSPGQTQGILRHPEVRWYFLPWDGMGKPHSHSCTVGDSGEIKWHTCLQCSWSNVLIGWNCLWLTLSHCMFPIYRARTVYCVQDCVGTPEGIFLAHTQNWQLQDCEEQLAEFVKVYWITVVDPTFNGCIVSLLRGYIFFFCRTRVSVKCQLMFTHWSSHLQVIWMTSLTWSRGCAWVRRWTGCVST